MVYALAEGHHPRVEQPLKVPRVRLRSRDGRAFCYSSDLEMSSVICLLRRRWFKPNGLRRSECVWINVVG